jgi:hypothetical protein
LPVTRKRQEGRRRRGGESAEGLEGEGEEGRKRGSAEGRLKHPEELREAPARSRISTQVERAGRVTLGNGVDRSIERIDRREGRSVSIDSLSRARKIYSTRLRLFFSRT